MLTKTLDPEMKRNAEALAERKWGSDWRSKSLDVQLAHLVEPSPEVVPLSRRSYLLAAVPQQEGKVEQALRDAGFDVYLPREPKSIRVGHVKRRITMRPMLPGYLFPIFDEHRDRWQLIPKIDGVLRLFLFGERPVPVPEDAVQRIRDRETEEKLRELEEQRIGKKGTAPFVAMPGDFVQIEDGGSWHGFIGEVVDLVARARYLVVELNLFGRKTPMTISVERVTVL